MINELQIARLDRAELSTLAMRCMEELVRRCEERASLRPTRAHAAAAWALVACRDVWVFCVHDLPIPIEGVGECRWDGERLRLGDVVVAQLDDSDLTTPPGILSPESLDRVRVALFRRGYPINPA